MNSSNILINKITGTISAVAVANKFYEYFTK